jgi:hypothetical protein
MAQARKAGAAALALPVLLGSVALTLAACKGDQSQPDPSATATAVPQGVAAGGAVPNAQQAALGTPLAERVAVIGLLNKRNNEAHDFVLKVGEAKRFGNVVVKLSSCERTAPWETTQEVGAFVQVFIEERLGLSDPLRWRKAFSGWLFRNSPGLNVMQHPVYDVWVKDCAMKFPGEEENPADFAAAKAAPKPVASEAAPAEEAPAAAPAEDAEN